MKRSDILIEQTGTAEELAANLDRLNNATHVVVLTTTDHPLYVGTKKECEIILEAFINYNNAHHIKIQEITD